MASFIVALAMGSLSAVADHVKHFARRPDLLIVGDVTIDTVVGSNGSISNHTGGAVSYAAVAAAVLGLRTCIVTGACVLPSAALICKLERTECRIPFHAQWPSLLARTLQLGAARRMLMLSCYFNGLDYALGSTGGSPWGVINYNSRTCGFLGRLGWWMVWWVGHTSSAAPLIPERP